MSDVILTNGQTTLKFRAQEFQLLNLSPASKQRIIHQTSAGIDYVHTVGDGANRIIPVELCLFPTTTNGYSGVDSLIDFFEASDGSGVDGPVYTWMLTDCDGISYQVRFDNDDMAGGLRRMRNHYEGSLNLRQEYTLPTDLTSLTAWWAAYDMDGNGGNLSAWTTSDPVGATGKEWDDRGANSYDTTQSTSGERPLWKTAQINSRPGVDFDGTDDNLINNTVPTALNTTEDAAWSAYTVIDADADGSDDIVFGAGNATTTDEVEYLYRNATTDWKTMIHDGAASTTVGGGTPDSSPHIISIIYSGATLSMWVDGTRIVNASAINLGVLNLDRFRLGCGISAGANKNYFDGRIGETVIVHGTAHTTHQRRMQEYRLRDMWRIQLTQ